MSVIPDEVRNPLHLRQVRGYRRVADRKEGLGKSMADHTIFLGFFDYEWSAIGSLATAAAAGIALLLPIMLELRNRANDRAFEARQRQHVVDGAFTGLATLGDGLVAWCNRDARELHNALAWSVGISKRLDLYARQFDLSDEVMDACISVSSALAIFSEATAGDISSVLRHEETRAFHTAMTIAIHAKTVLVNLCARHGVTSPHRDDAAEEIARALDAMNRIPLDRRIETDF